MTEVLSPAGSIESVTAAVRAGADAVYFGTGSFNARRNARNFTDEDMAEAAGFCLVRGVKTYLTLNTLVSDGEMIDAQKAAYNAAQKGVDALIVQDLGLAALLHKNMPEMPLHASTQMSVHSAEGLYILKELGFSRVVPAREMDKIALQKFCKTAKSLDMEVEVFIHGALCMCVSGQCYLSSVLGGRSGNRGLCAQPCRLPFALKNGTGHDLSLKDMSYIDHIGKLIDMGVTSFKIEGRMKRPEYVAAATAAVRMAADGKSIPQEVSSALSGVFSRSGHTDGYFTNRLGKEMFGVRTETDEQLSKSVLTSTHNLYRLERQSVGLSGELTVKADMPISLSISDGKRKVTVCGEKPQAAINAAVTEAYLRQKVEKLGGTCYYFKNLDIVLGNGLAVSGGSLGALRKEAIKKLDELRSVVERSIGPFAADGTVRTPVKKTYEPNKVVAHFRSVEQIPKNLTGISAVILPAESDFKRVSYLNIPIIADIPRGVMHNSHKITELLKFAKECGVKAAVVNNISAFRYAEAAGLKPVAGFGLNVFNSNSLKVVESLGSQASVLSFECSLKDAAAINGTKFKGIITYGRLPLMLFRNCPGKNGGGCKSCGGKCVLTDRKGIEFPVMCRGEFSEMFNSRPVWMFDRTGEMNGIDFQLLYFTDETAERAEEVIAACVKRRSPDTEYTRGLYYREVL